MTHTTITVSVISAAPLDSTQHAGVTQESVNQRQSSCYNLQEYNKNRLFLTSVFHVLPYRASELPRSRSTRGPPEPLRPPCQQPHPGTLRPAARPPPPLPQENTSVTVRASPLLLTLGMNLSPFSQKQRANFQLSSDNQSSSEAPVTLSCLQWMVPPPHTRFAPTPPLRRARWSSPHRARRAIPPSPGGGGARHTGLFTVAPPPPPHPLRLNTAPLWAKVVLASPWQTCHPDRLWWGRQDCGDASGASAALTSHGKNTPEDLYG